MNFRVEGMAGGGAYPVTIAPASNSKWRFSVRCGSEMLHGNYGGVGTRGVTGTGRDAHGKDVRFEIDLEAGRGASAV